MQHRTPITFQTHDGQTVKVRRMLPADVNQLVDIFRHLSAESIYQRFREPTAQLSPIRILEEARALAQAGYSRGKGFLAFAHLPQRRGAPIAGARYIRTGEDAAEVALTVRDDFQRRGVGTALLRILIEEARRDGIRYLTAQVSANNRAALSLLRSYSFPQQRTYDGPEMTIVFDVSQDGVRPNAFWQTAMGRDQRLQIRPARSAQNAAPVPPDRR